MERPVLTVTSQLQMSWLRIPKISNVLRRDEIRETSSRDDLKNFHGRNPIVSLTPSLYRPGPRHLPETTHWTVWDPVLFLLPGRMSQILSTRHSMLANRRISPALRTGCRSTSLIFGNAIQPVEIFRKTPLDEQSSIRYSGPMRRMTA